MSLADDKRSVFNTIGAYTSLIQEGQLPKQTDLFPSINSKDDIVPFLLDVLKTVAGTEALKESIGGMFTSLLDEVEPKIKTELKKQFVQSNANQPLPNDFVNNGITVPVKTIDVRGKFKNAPDSDVGNLIYGSSTNFDKVAYNSILTGSFEDYQNMSIKYIEGSDSFQIKPNVSGVPDIGTYFSEYIDGAQIIDKKVITSSVMDAFYGTLTKKEDKTVEQTYEELQVDVLLQQVLNGDDSFVISPEKYDELLNKANEAVVGEMNYDLGCGLMPAEFGFDDFNSFISTISGTTDPFAMGNEFESTINQSTSGSTVTEGLTDENKQTIKDGFFQRIIQTFTIKLLDAVTAAPQIRTLFGMISSFENGGTVLLDKATNDMENFKTCIKCMSKEIMDMIAEFIFALAVSYLIKLLKPVIIKVLKEKINQYINIIKSLTGPAGDIAGELTG